MRHRFPWMPWVLTLSVVPFGCMVEKDRSETEATVNGKVDGTSLTVESAWWGGPFMVLLNQDCDCIDLSWVDRYYETGEAPLDEDLVALQFTFSEEVDGGHYDLTGEAVLTARLLVIQSGGFDTTRATTGQVDVDEIDNNEVAWGAFDLGFDEGALVGSFAVERCMNLED